MGRIAFAAQSNLPFSALPLKRIETPLEAGHFIERMRDNLQTTIAIQTITELKSSIHCF